MLLRSWWENRLLRRDQIYRVRLIASTKASKTSKYMMTGVYYREVLNGSIPVSW